MTYKITNSNELKAALETTFAKIDDYSHLLMKAEEEEKAAFNEYQRKLRIIENKYNSKEVQLKMKKLQDSIPEIEGGIYKEFYDNLFDMVHYYEKKGMDISNFLESSLDSDFGLILVTEPERSRIRATKDGLYTLGPVEDSYGETWGEEEDDNLDFVMNWDKDYSSEELEAILCDLDLRLRYIYLAGLAQSFCARNKKSNVQEAVENILRSVDIELKDELSDAEFRYPDSVFKRLLPSGKVALERIGGVTRILLFNPERDIDEIQNTIEEELKKLSEKIVEEDEYSQYLKLKEKYEK